MSSGYAVLKKGQFLTLTASNEFVARRNVLSLPFMSAQGGFRSRLPASNRLP